MGAGNETARNLLTGSVLAFAEFPGEWERLHADHALMRPAVEEMTRTGRISGTGSTGSGLWVVPLRR